MEGYACHCVLSPEWNVDRSDHLCIESQTLAVDVVCLSLSATAEDAVLQVSTICSSGLSTQLRAEVGQVHGIFNSENLMYAQAL